MTLQSKVAATTSVLLRLLAYVFLRWIPAHPVPPLIYTLFALYIPSFIATFLTQPAYNVLVDTIDVAVIDEVIPTTRSTPMHIEEEIEITETIVAEPKSTMPFKTLLTGLPSPTSAILSLLTLLVNIALVAAVTDSVYRARTYHASEDLSFARIGYVSASEAKLLLREPDETKWPMFVQLRIKDPQPMLHDPRWQPVGGANFMTADTDWTVALSLPLMQGIHPPDYEWRTSNGHNGSFRGGLQTGAKLFEARGNSLSFVTSSCIIPNFPYNPLEHPLAIPGFRHLGKWLAELTPHFMLFLGDFIYVDVPRRHGNSVEDYRREYRQVYASPDWPLVSNLSWIHVLDDHEIANDYDLGPDTSIFQAASDPFQHYHAAVNPPPARRAGMYGNELRANASWYEFEAGPAIFFMLDTRRHRTPTNKLAANATEKSMLGATQLADLLHFLSRPLPHGVRWKIVISSVPFTRNWGGPSGDDTWAGYLSERSRILEAMWDAGMGGAGVVVLSGDRHEFASTKFPPPKGSKWDTPGGGQEVAVWEFSTSPLSQFYLPIPTYKEHEGDVIVKYLPSGNSKFGAIDINLPAHSATSTLRFRLFVDGEEAWETTITSPVYQSSYRDRIKQAVLGLGLKPNMQGLLG